MEATTTPEFLFSLTIALHVFNFALTILKGTHKDAITNHLPFMWLF
jgi:hypothetical protein